MEKEFVPYGLSLELEKLGFDEECFGYYVNTELDLTWKFSDCSLYQNIHNSTLAPLYQQAFRWFMIKCEQICEKEISLKFWLDGSGSCKLMNLDDELFNYDSEIECLKKLIEIVKNK